MVPRGLSLNDVCAALRPFYSVVHPDRFARNPRVKEQNERSLQVFNGYLNDLFPVSGNVRPISVRFSIPSKEEDNLHDIDITLSGTDPMKIVRHALESCNLSTKDIPIPQSVEQPVKFPSIKSSTFSRGFPDIENDMSKIYSKKKKYEPPATDLVSVLRNSRDDAIQKSKAAAEVKLALRGFVEDVKKRAGVKDVIWQMHWKESHMRSCIGNLNRLLDQANVQDSVFRALYKNTIRFV